MRTHRARSIVLNNAVSIYFIYALATFSSINVSATQIVVSLTALQMGANPFEVGTLAAAFAFLPMLFAVTAGKLIDRYGGRWPMTFGAAAAVVGLLMPFVFPGIAALYVTATMAGLAVVFFNLATQNLVGVLSTPETRVAFFSNYMLTNAMAQFFGPPIGGFLVEGTAHPTMYLAAMMLVPLALLAWRGKQLPGGTAQVRTGGGGLRALVADRAVRTALITGSLLNAGLNLFQVYMPVYMHSIGIAASVIGIVMAMNSAATFVVRFALPRLLKKFGEQQLLAYAFFCGAAGLVITPFLHGPFLLSASSFLFGAGMGCGQPIVIMMMFSNSRDGRSGEALGLKVATNQFTKLVTPMLFGAVATALGVPPTFWINAAIMLMGGWMSRPVARKPPDGAPPGGGSGS